jgi:hypothetical protein
LSLIEEIMEKNKEVATDRYSMSVGELIAMYKDGELLLRPEYQRLFRWTPEQKSRLIESLILGIPVPSIFISQLEDGTWEIIDGLQRMSTILETAGELLHIDGNKKSPLILTRTKYLPSLEGKSWNHEDSNQQLPNEAKLRIKRSRIDVNIVLSKSDPTSKYELFQRLNTGGTPATDQEVRNAILVMTNPEFYSWISELSTREYFKECIIMSDRALEEQFDLELITRFIVFRNLELDELRNISELGTFLTDKIVSLAEDPSFNKEENEIAFKRTFESLARVLGDKSFKRYNAVKDTAQGAMLISIFEIIAIGMSYYLGIAENIIHDEKIIEVHKALPAESRFSLSSGQGVRASTRIPNTIGLGREMFKL